MKNLLKEGTLILFVGLISLFVAYKSGGFDQEKELPISARSVHVQVEDFTGPDTLDNQDSPETVVPKEDPINFQSYGDFATERNPLISSSKVVIVHEKWDEHAAAVSKFVKQMDSIKKLDSIQRAKEWETVSPR